MARSTNDKKDCRTFEYPLARRRVFAYLDLGERNFLWYGDRIFRHGTPQAPMATVSTADLTLDMAVVEDTYPW